MKLTNKGTATYILPVKGGTSVMVNPGQEVEAEFAETEMLKALMADGLVTGDKPAAKPEAPAKAEK